MHESAMRDIPLCRLALAPENVRKTPPDEAAEAQLRASIADHDLLENLVVRPDEPDADGIERFAVVAGGRRLATLKALAENDTLHADHAAPCKIAANGNAGELSLAENVESRARFEREDFAMAGVHRHHRARRLSPGHPGVGEVRRHAEGHRRPREQSRRRCR